MQPNEYQCDCCGGIFEKGWSDEEAIAELDEAFPDASPDECNLICDDCFNKHFGELVRQ